MTGIRTHTAKLRDLPQGKKQTISLNIVSSTPNHTRNEIQKLPFRNTKADVNVKESQSRRSPK